MKIDRLIGILTILLQQDRVTAPFLASRFEVSRRTINRDIEDLCRAGIPIVTAQGAGGGISIMEGYRMDKTLLTSSEMSAILAGLESLDSVSKTGRYQQLMDKLSAGNSSLLASDRHILINLASWYGEALAPKIELFQKAIGKKEWVAFTYYGPGGQGLRRIEPYLLVFQWANWYIYGWCDDRKAFRLFKLNRMMDLRLTGEVFPGRPAGKPELNSQRIFQNSIQAEVLIEGSMKWRLVEEFGIDSFEDQESGRLLFKYGFADQKQLFSWILSMGEKAELLKPEKYRKELARKIAAMGAQY